MLDTSQVGPVLNMSVQGDVLGYVNGAMVHVQLEPGFALLLHLVNDHVTDAIDMIRIVGVEVLRELHFGEEVRDIFAIGVAQGLL